MKIRIMECNDRVVAVHHYYAGRSDTRRGHAETGPYIYSLVIARSVSDEAPKGDRRELRRMTLAE